MKQAIFLICLFLIFSCGGSDSADNNSERAFKSSNIGTGCTFTLGDPSKTPNLQTKAFIGDSAYWNHYDAPQIMPIFKTDAVVGSYDALIGNLGAYGDTVDLVELWCLIENKAGYASGGTTDWVYNESQGKDTVDARGRHYIIYEGLLKEAVFSGGVLLYENYYKRGLEPSVTWYGKEAPEGTIYYQGNGVWAIQAQGADLYRNRTKIPKDSPGKYVIRITVNPSENGCNAINESNFTDNNFIVPLNVPAVAGLATVDPSAIAENVPGPVENLQGTVYWGKEKYVQLLWSSKAEKFNIYRDGNVIARSVEGQEFLDRNLPNGWKKSSYTVRAENEGIGSSGPVTIQVKR